MAITKDEIIELMNQFHDVVMKEKGDGKAQAKFFFHPEPRIIILHGTDLSMQRNYEIHQNLEDEIHVPCKDWLITPLCDQPERARCVGAVYWQARQKGSTKLLKCVVGEDWIVQRIETGELKIVMYINSYHHFLPDSSSIDLK